MKILCGGPVSEDADIFSAHIESLKAQGRLHYKGIDNGPYPLDPPTGFESVTWRRINGLGEYKQDRIRWTKMRMRFIGDLREEMRLAALNGNYDYLLMVDTDLILGEGTLDKLLRAGKDIIAGLFWTRFRPNSRRFWPNVWGLMDNVHVPPSEEMKAKIQAGGVHEVDMTGACTLLSRYALERVSYAAQRNVMSEDICMIRTAKAAGIPVFVDCDVKIEHRRRR